MGASPGQFHRPMELCVSPEDSSIFVVDGYNHRVQVLFLPELQAARKAATIIQEKKSTESHTEHIRPSKLCVQSSISLLRIPKYHEQSSALSASNIDTVTSRVTLHIPRFGSYISVPTVDIDYLLGMDFFSTPSEEDFSSELETNTAQVTTDRRLQGRNFPNHCNSKLNHQAAVFMGLITGVVTDTREYDDTSSSCIVDYATGGSSPKTMDESGMGSSSNEGSLFAALDSESKLGKFEVDYSLIVPSVFALDALLSRGWLPGTSIPSPVIHSLVHLMCYGDVTIISTGDSTDRCSATSAACHCR